MNSFLTLILFILCIILLFYLFALFKDLNINENFNNKIYLLEYPNNTSDKTHTNFPWWNSQIGTKKNMSYDLRGDISPADYINFPFNMSTIIPIINNSI